MENGPRVGIRGRRTRFLHSLRCACATILALLWPVAVRLHGCRGTATYSLDRIWLKSPGSRTRERFPMRLLIADDDSDMRQSMKLLLERAGHEVELAVDGADALQIQRARAFDVLITDIFMGEADGLVAIESFRREFPATRI